MSSGVPGKDLRKLNFGAKVDRATAVLPATTTQNLFSVSGGRIILLGLVGEVTVVASATATTLTFQSAPTVGTAVALNLNTGSAIENAVVGSLVTITGTFGDAAIISGGAGQILDSKGLVIPAGFIRILTSATNTASLRYSVFYTPLDDGASVAAV